MKINENQRKSMKIIMVRIKTISRSPGASTNNDYKDVCDARILENPKILLNRAPDHPQNRRSHQTGRKFDARLDWIGPDLQNGRKTSKQIFFLISWAPPPAPMTLGRRTGVSLLDKLRPIARWLSLPIAIHPHVALLAKSCGQMLFNTLSRIEKGESHVGSGSRFLTCVWFGSL